VHPGTAQWVRGPAVVRRMGGSKANDKVKQSAKSKGAEKAAAAEAARLKAQEDASWQDNDKAASRKAERSKGKEDKMNEKLAKKAELRMLAEADMQASSPKAKAPQKKMTRYEVELLSHERVRDLEARRAADEAAQRNVSDMPELEENLNRVRIEGEATTMDEALAVLSSGAKEEKMTFKKFKERELPLMKEEFPRLKLSQLQEKVYTKWQRSSENPANMP